MTGLGHFGITSYYQITPFKLIAQGTNTKYLMLFSCCIHLMLHKKSLMVHGHLQDRQVRSRQSAVVLVLPLSYKLTLMHLEMTLPSKKECDSASKLLCIELRWFKS